MPSLLQFTLLPQVPGLLSILLLSSSTLFNYILIDGCSGYGNKLLNWGLSLYVISFGICLSPSFYYLIDGVSVNQSICIILYFFSTVFTSLSTKIKENTLMGLNTPPCVDKIDQDSKIIKVIILILFSPLLSKLYIPFNDIDSGFEDENGDYVNTITGFNETLNRLNSPLPLLLFCVTSLSTLLTKYSLHATLLSILNLNLQSNLNYIPLLFSRPILISQMIGCGVLAIYTLVQVRN